MKVSMFYLPSVGSRAEIEGGLAGLRPELYQRMLAELSEQIRLGDQLGYDSVSFTEHHFHVEGFELSNNPVLLGLWAAMQTERLRVGQLGIVLPAENPLRVAENIAMLDHMSGGRAYAGFARGYQRRWVDTMAQHTHGVRGVQPHQHDAVDEANRAAFEECYRLVKAAWTEDLVSVDGEFWRVPVEGTPWDVESTRRYGAGVRDGVVTALGPVPKPLQRPHPPVFQPFTSSERSVRWCAQERITAVLPPMHPVLERRLVDVYAEASGRPAGEGIGLLRDVVVAGTDEEALALWSDGPLFGFQSWFAPFGFDRGLAHPDTGEMPDVLDASLALVGSVDTVTRQLERLLERLPVGWIFAWEWNGLVPHQALLRSIELFATEVAPRVGGLEGPPPAPAARAGTTTAAGGRPR
jgi:alkanesulfonate monooxygenase SsuD/methylene tetrahydromethanopterin reductase-like flavin-dependent oxidoreductase (luciferase family)